MTATIPQSYSRKIKTRDELIEILGPRPRQKSVIMCHGTFDLVHPGHVRHLMYAKEKADILVASLTSDAHISKANFRPFVPHQLRAMNLAALEMVDYVLVDENPTPIENLKVIQPDYFAKGYEYFNGGLHPKTQEEVDALNTYGGEVLFTPGDVVYSSSAFIEQAPPNISTDKLAILMESEGVTFDDLRSALTKFSNVRVHVVGDTIVDSYVYCTPISSGMAKTPTLSVKYERQVDYAGGAAVVSRHMRQTGAKVKFTTVLGEDFYKDFVLHEMEAHDIDCEPIIDSTRVTTQKTVFTANGYRLLKFDKVDNRPVSGRVLEKLIKSISSSEVDVVVFSDFRHGIFSKSTIPQLIESIPQGLLRVADSQVASRWGNILEFQDFDLITPNEREARFALGDQDSVIRPLALELYKRAQCKLLMLKLGDKGIITYRAPSPDVRSFFTVDSFTEKLVDAVGAGDALLSYATLSLVATGSPVIASILGSIGAALACEHEGNNPVLPEDVLKKLDILERRAHYA
ncbi:MAG: PfkB family carbohydrate kinase [Leptolyngbyaceae cyanobacterium bins.59]|nr:PfkB family carbohydrate kinase [Leptolyngbyaceae cyanobacterium bins.59]